MRRIVTTLLTCALATFGLVAIAPAAAHADSVPASVSAVDTVRWNDCRYYTYSYDVGDSYFPSAGWDAQVTLYDPTGESSDSDFLYDGADARSGTSEFFVCGGEPAGTWKITMRVDYHDTDYVGLGSQYVTATWHLRSPRTRTSVRVNDRTPHYGQILRFRIGSTVEKPSGYFGNAYETVVLQARRNGVWTTMKGSRAITNQYGVVTVRGKWLQHRRLLIRAVTVTTSEFSGSYSGSIRVG